MNSVITGIKSVIDGSTTLDSLGNPEFYPYSVPSSATFPYIISEVSDAGYWTTLGSVSEGFQIPLRFIIYSHQNYGGSKRSREIADELESLFNKNEFDISSGSITSCLLDGKSLPFENPEDPDFYYQNVDFKIITEGG